MVNTDDFIKRLEHLLDYYSLTASSFADKIRVQRSSISHLLSGRNKPSLDFVMKIIDVFPEVNLYWMLNGKGNFLKSETSSSTPSPTLSEPENVSAHSFSLFENEQEPSLFDTDIPVPEVTVPEQQKRISSPEWLSTEKSDIYKIVIFYKDGTFRDFKPQE